MSTDQQVGQLFLVGLANDRLGPQELGLIRNQHVGSVWLTRTTTIGVAGVRAIADAVQAEASSSATAGTRFFFVANQEGGNIQALQGEGFSTIPSAVKQGEMPIDVLHTSARTWGRELADAGINLDFAPVADVVPANNVALNQPIGVLHREYGSDPQAAGSHAAAFVAGLAAAGVATTAKHFPGLGRVTGNTDFTRGVVDDQTTATDPFLESFGAVIDAGAQFVMVGLATYTQIDPDNLAAFSSTVIDGLLRTDLGFRGVVMSDDLGNAAAVADMTPADRAEAFLAAGGDLIVTQTADTTLAMVVAVQARAASEPDFAQRVNEAAHRVLDAKDAQGLLPCSARE